MGWSGRTRRDAPDLHLCGIAAGRVFTGTSKSRFLQVFLPRAFIDADCIAKVFFKTVFTLQPPLLRCFRSDDSFALNRSQSLSIVPFLFILFFDSIALILSCRFRVVRLLSLVELSKRFVCHRSTEGSRKLRLKSFRYLDLGPRPLHPWQQSAQVKAKMTHVRNAHAFTHPHPTTTCHILC